MLGEFLSFLAKGSKGETINSWVFQLHYRWTSSVLLLLALIFTQLRVFGANIECVDPYFNKDVSREALNSHCWTSYQHPKITGGNLVTFDAYYQYVAMILVLLAMAFYVPRHFWSTFESGTTMTLAKKLSKLKTDPEEAANDYVQALAGDLRSRTQHDSLLYAYLLCESANLVLDALFLLLIFQVDVEGDTSNALGFLKAVVLKDPWRPDFKPFPKDISCNYTWPKDAVQPRTVQCLLPVNAFIQPVLILLTYWLAALTALAVATLFIRISLLSHSGRRIYVWLRLRDFGMLPEVHLEGPAAIFDRHNWLLFRLLKKNLHRTHYIRLLEAFRKNVQPPDEGARQDHVHARMPKECLEALSLLFRACAAYFGYAAGVGIGDALLEIMKEKEGNPEGHAPAVGTITLLVVVVLVFREVIVDLMCYRTRPAFRTLSSPLLDLAVVGVGAWAGVMASLVDHRFQSSCGTLAMAASCAMALGLRLYNGWRYEEWTDKKVVGVSATLVLLAACAYGFRFVWDSGYGFGHDLTHDIDISVNALQPLWLRCIRAVLFVIQGTVFFGVLFTLACGVLSQFFWKAGKRTGINGPAG